MPKSTNPVKVIREKCLDCCCGQHGSSTNVIINACNISQNFFDRSGKLLRFCFFQS